VDSDSRSRIRVRVVRVVRVGSVRSRRREKSSKARRIFETKRATRRRPRVVAPDANRWMGVVTGALFVRVGVLPARIERDDGAKKNSPVYS